MKERIRWFEAQTTSHADVYFPFTQGGLCAQLPKTLISPLQIFEQSIGSLTLRIAQPNDAPYLAPLLRSYGEASENYDDLECFNEGKLPVVVANIANCLQHRYFITFLLFDGVLPIAFLQIDPYDISTIRTLFEQKLLPFWNAFFREPLQPDTLLSLSNEERFEALHALLYPDALEHYGRTYRIDCEPNRFLRFLVGSLQTVNSLRQSLPDEHYIGNLSYTLLPDYRRRGLMSQVLQSAEIVARSANIDLFFSDRIAERNTASVALLQHNGFQVCGSFTTFYGNAYKTRRHPDGNFSEPCVCCHKRLHSEYPV